MACLSTLEDAIRENGTPRLQKALKRKELGLPSENLRRVGIVLYQESKKYALLSHTQDAVRYKNVADLEKCMLEAMIGGLTNDQLVVSAAVL